MMEKSFDILNHHPINEARAEKGLNKANSIWFWGAGTKPALDDFKEKTGMNGAMVSAVDLLKGIAVGANMRNLDVEGANGGLDTNYHGKAMAAVEALLEKNDDFAYIHVEAPDEMGHQGSLENKIKAIEHLDKEVVKVVKEELEKAGEDFRILIGPDLILHRAHILVVGHRTLFIALPESFCPHLDSHIIVIDRKIL